MSRDRSIHVNQDHIWWWLSPEPLKAATTPSVEVAHADVGTITPALTAIAGEGTVTAITGDRQTLTLSAPIASSAGVAGEYGEAWLITAEDGAFPCRVKRIDGTTVNLAEPLTTRPSLTAGARLQFRRWYTTLTTVDVTGTARRGWVVNTTYTAEVGADMPDEVRRDRLVLNVVQQPFSTGLTHESLLGWFSDLNHATPGRQQDYRPQIERARALLVADIRARIAAADSTCIASEDDIDGGRLEQSHAYRTASLIYAVRDQARATWFSEQYKALIDEELQRIWADCDGDGLPDEGELDTALSVGAGDRGTFYTALDPTPTFTRGMKH